MDTERWSEGEAGGGRGEDGSSENSPEPEGPFKHLQLHQQQIDHM